MLDNHLQHLRSIKDTEEKWLERMFAVFGGGIAWMATQPEMLKPMSSLSMACVFLSPFVFAIFFLQHVMAKERLSYYRVMRSVIRAQSLLNMFAHGFLSQGMRSAAFPLGLGPTPHRDGTQPFSSFGYRQTAIFMFFVTFLGLASMNLTALPIWLPVTLAILNLCWVVHLYVLDDVKLYRAVLQERGTAGFQEDWVVLAKRAISRNEELEGVTYFEALKRLPRRWHTRG